MAADQVGRHARRDERGAQPVSHVLQRLVAVARVVGAGAEGGAGLGVGVAVGLRRQTEDHPDDHHGGAAAGPPGAGAKAGGTAATTGLPAETNFTTTRSFCPAMGATWWTCVTISDFSTRTSCAPGRTTLGRASGAVPTTCPSIEIVLPTSSVCTSR